jgi:hypothetical protein
MTLSVSVKARLTFLSENQPLWSLAVLQIDNIRILITRPDWALFSAL